MKVAGASQVASMEERKGQPVEMSSNKSVGSNYSSDCSSVDAQSPIDFKKKEAKEHRKNISMSQDIDAKNAFFRVEDKMVRSNYETEKPKADEDFSLLSEEEKGRNNSLVVQNDNYLNKSSMNSSFSSGSAFANYSFHQSQAKAEQSSSKSGGGIEKEARPRRSRGA